PLPRRRPGSSLNYYKVLIASSEIMQQHITQLMCRLHKPDILVEMPADSYGIFEFYRSKELIEAGRAATRAALERDVGGSLKTAGFLSVGDRKSCDGPF
ncbi:MAG: hypothetical protein V8Q54_01135, partial [Alistipes senegalensis]